MRYPHTHNKTPTQLKKEVTARRKEREGYPAKMQRLLATKARYERVHTHNESLRAVDEVCEQLWEQQAVNISLGATPRRGVVRPREEQDDASSVSSRSSGVSLSSHFTGVSVREEAQPVVPVLVACSICQEDVSAEQQQHVLSCCDSTFHVSCIDQWVATNPTCPHCRVAVDLDALQASFARRQGLQGGSQLELFVRGVNGSTVVMCPPSNALVGDLKRMMTIPVSVQRFVFDGHELEDNRTLASYGIEDHDTLHCLLRLRGGMEASEEEVELELEEALESVLPSVLLDIIMEYHSDDHCHYCSEVVLVASGFNCSEIEAAQAYCLNSGDEVGHFDLEHFREAYRGHFNTHGEFCREQADRSDIFSELRDRVAYWVEKCIDWERVWDCAFRYDFSEFDGHYFWGGSEDIDHECECESCCEAFSRTDCRACRGWLCADHLCLDCTNQQDEVEA